MPEGFARIAAVSLPVHLGDVEANEREIMLALERLRTQGVQAAVFPELCLTGYTLGDLLLHGLVQDRAWAALKRLKAHTDGLTACPSAMKAVCTTAPRCWRMVKFGRLCPKPTCPMAMSFMKPAGLPAERACTKPYRATASHSL